MSDVRRVAAALMRHGDYYEGADSIEWLKVDAAEVAEVAHAGPDAVVAVLWDLGWVDDITPGGPERAMRVAAEVCS